MTRAGLGVAPQADGGLRLLGGARPPLAVSLVVFLGSAAYLRSFSAEGFNIRDEWVIPHGALRVLHGEVPWKDFQSYAPGAYYLHALAFAGFGSRLSVARALAVLLTALMVVLMVHAGARLMPLPFALLAGTLLLVAPGVYYGRYINFFSLFSILAFFPALGGGPRPALILGLVGGVTALFREDLGLVVLGAAGLCFVLAARAELRPPRPARWTPLAPLTIGAALVLLPWALYYWAQSALGEILRVHVRALGGGYDKMSLPFPRLDGLVADGRWGETVAFYGPVLVLALTAGLLLRRYRRGERPAETVALTYVLLVGGLMFHQAVWRTTLENHAKVMAPILLLTGYLLWRGGRSLWRLGVARPGLRPLAVAGGLALAAGPGLYAHAMLTYPFGFYVGSRSIPREGLVRMALPGGAVLAPREWAAPTLEATRYLQAHTRPAEPIFVVPFAPMFYMLVDRPNPSFFEWILPAEPSLYPDLEPRVLADLERARPRYVVLEDFPLDGREDRRFSHYAPGIARYLAERYAVEARFGDYQLLRRQDGDRAALSRDAPPPPRPPSPPAGGRGASGRAAG